VGLIRAYSNPSGPLEELARAVRRLERAVPDDGQDEPCSVRSSGRVGRVWALSERLSDEQVQAMVAKFKAGTPKQQLADEFGISLSSVKRILRKRR
jgi:DNA-directed RNA polymerase specialized sigma24 family protein